MRQEQLEKARGTYLTENCPLVVSQNRPGLLPGAPGKWLAVKPFERGCDERWSKWPAFPSLVGIWLIVPVKRENWTFIVFFQTFYEPSWNQPDRHHDFSLRREQKESGLLTCQAIGHGSVRMWKIVAADGWGPDWSWATRVSGRMLDSQRVMMVVMIAAGDGILITCRDQFLVSQEVSVIPDVATLHPE